MIDFILQNNLDNIFIGAALTFLQVGLGYRMLREKSQLFNVNGVNILLLSAFITNAFLIAYFVILVFDNGTDTLIEHFWVPVFRFLEITILGIHFLNGTINKLIEALETKWTNIFRS